VETFFLTVEKHPPRTQYFREKPIFQVLSAPSHLPHHVPHGQAAAVSAKPTAGALGPGDGDVEPHIGDGMGAFDAAGANGTVSAEEDRQLSTARLRSPVGPLTWTSALRYCGPYSVASAEVWKAQ